MAVTWNAGDLAHVTLSGSNLLATYDNSGTRGGVRANISKSVGKWYYEIKYNFTAGVNNDGGGWASVSKDFTTSFMGNDTISFGAYTSNSIFFNSAGGTSWIATPVTGDWVAIALDLDTNKVYAKDLTQSAGWNNGAADPNTNTGGLDISALTGTPWFPAVAFEAVSSGTYSFLANFGATTLQGTVPTGFTALDTPSLTPQSILFSQACF